MWRYVTQMLTYICTDILRERQEVHQNSCNKPGCNVGKKKFGKDHEQEAKIHRVPFH